MNVGVCSTVGRERRDDGPFEVVAEPEHAMAELKVDIEEAGDWFGGGHLMKQHWPLNLGCWEVGPHYPFDNGPNGINTLVSTHWVTSGGLAVLGDPDTPYLHVGLNAPQSNGLWDRLVSNRSFGVGIQNATRVMLPLQEGVRTGDGVLRLQARGGFGKGRGAFQMDHPMIGWEGAGGQLGSVDEGVDADYDPARSSTCPFYVPLVVSFVGSVAHFDGRGDSSHIPEMA